MNTCKNSLDPCLSHSQTSVSVSLNYDVTKLLSWGFWKFMRKLASGIQGFKLTEVYAQGGSEKRKC